MQVMRTAVLAALIGAILVPSTSCAKTTQRRAASKGKATSTAAAPTSPAPAPTKRAVARMLVRKVRMDLAVSKVHKARGEVERLTREAGGYVHSGAYEVEHKRRHWSAILKVPPPALPKVLRSLRAVGRVERESLDTVEVTAAVMDVRARLKSHRTAEGRLQKIASQKTASVEELLSVEKELVRLRSKIEQLEATERRYAGSVGLATITIALRPKRAVAIAPSAWARVSGAFAAGLRHLFDFLVLLAVALGHLWPFLLLLLAISVALFRLRRLIRKAFTFLFGVKPLPPRPAYATEAYYNHGAMPPTPEAQSPKPEA